MTKIKEMDRKVCDAVCTLYQRGQCQAPRTNKDYGLDKETCPVGKEKALEWLREKKS